MQSTMTKAERRESGLETYVICGGKEGAARLNVLARVLAPSTGSLLDTLGPLQGFTIVDAACGGGDVTIDLAKRAGPMGLVFGFDLDTEKLQAASERVRAANLTNCAFMHADVTKPWTVRGVNMVYARFILTHLAEPRQLLANAWNALVPGGMMVVEDIDTEGVFWHPASRAVEKFRRLYVEVTQSRGCDPFIGRKLNDLLETSGFAEVCTALVQPYSRQGDVKDTITLTFKGIGDSVVSSGLASKEELAGLIAEIDTYASRADTTIAFPRVFQAWGVKQ
jgi:ubiquinone/menaquinone biosynthesis C-methylase UbiE